MQKRSLNQLKSVPSVKFISSINAYRLIIAVCKAWRGLSAQRHQGPSTAFRDTHLPTYTSPGAARGCYNSGCDCFLFVYFLLNSKRIYLSVYRFFCTVCDCKLYLVVSRTGKQTVTHKHDFRHRLEVLKPVRTAFGLSAVYSCIAWETKALTLRWLTFKCKTGKRKNAQYIPKIRTSHTKHFLHEFLMYTATIQRLYHTATANYK